MKKITVSILSVLMMLSMVFSSSVFAANEQVSAWESFKGLIGINASETTDVVGVEYRGHIENKGDYPLDPATWVQGPNRLGTVGEALRLEGFWIQLTDKPADVNIKYQVHVQNEGWMEPVLNGAFAGTKDKAQRIEAIKIWLVDDAGEAVTGYSVEYRGHVENVGDVPQTAGDWYADGFQLGTVGASQRLEALEVKIVKTKADMTAYDAAVVAAAELTEDDYTAESWEVLTDALAVEVTADNTQAEVDAATEAIEIATGALVFANQADLDNAKLAIADLVEADYTAESWAAIAPALELPETTNAEVGAKALALGTAYADLVFAGQADLDVVVAEAATKTEADYTAATWAVLVEALELPETTNAEVVAKTAAITEAIAGLVEVANMEAYDAIVAAAGEVVEADYTAATYAALQTALEENVVTNADTQEDVDAATAAITAAYGKLVALTKVTVVEALNATQAKVTFSGPVEAVIPANFLVKDANNNTAFVSSVKLNAAKTEATLTFFNKFVDKGVYTVTNSNIVDVNKNTVIASANAFAYVKADAAKVEFIATTIAPGTGTNTINALVKVTDTLGRDISNEVTLEFETSNQAVINESGVVQASQDGNSAIMVAKVKVGTTYVKSPQTTIKVTSATQTTFVGYNVFVTGANPAATTDAFLSLTADKKADYVYKSDINKSLAMYFTDQLGASMDAMTTFNATGVVVTNLTPTIVIVDPVTGAISPMSAGEGYVRIKVGSLEQTIKITVLADPIIKTMELEKTDANVVIGNSSVVKVIFKDQYGKVVSSTPTSATSASASRVVAVPGANIITLTGVTEGTTTVEVKKDVVEGSTTTTLKQTLNVTVVKAGTLASYSPVSAFNTIDVNSATTSTTVPNTTQITVNQIDTNGNITGTVPAGDAELTEVAADGTVVSSNNKISINNTTNVVTAEKTGTAYVQVKVGTLVVGTLQLNVTNTAQAATTATFNSLAAVFGEVNSKTTGIDDAAIQAKLNTLVAIRDQNGVVMTDQTAVFDYTVTNQTGINAELTELSAPNATASIIVTSVTVSGSTNLITTPVQIAFSAQDTIAPVVTGVVAGDVGNTTTGITPDSAATDIKATVLTKNGTAVGGYTLATKVDDIGSYILTVTDYAGNATIVNFTIAPATVATLTTSSTVKGESVTSLGTPSSTLANASAGTVTISTAKAADTTNATTFITEFLKTDANSTTKVVKYADGASTANFATDTAFDPTATITDDDFFIVRVTAEDGTTVNYYKVVVTVV